MSSLVTPFAETVYLHDIDTLEWRRTATEESVRVEIVVGGTSVISTTLHFLPSDSRVQMYDMAVLLFPYVANTFGIEDGFDGWARVKIVTNGLAQSALVVPTTIRLSQRLVPYTGRHFLSLLSGRKRIPEGGRDRIALYCHEDEQGDLEAALLWEKNGKYTLSGIPLHDYLSVEGRTFYTFDIDLSSDLFQPADPLERLVSMEVTFGRRRQEFEIVSRLDGEATSFAFVNSFGQLEYFHAFGLRTEEHKYSRSAALFSDGKRTYRIEATPEVEVQTGLMERGTQAAFEDLLRSQSVWVDGEPVVITQAIYKPTSSPYARNAATISYEYANGSICHAGRRPRLFDKTFDQSFE